MAFSAKGSHDILSKQPSINLQHKAVLGLLSQDYWESVVVRVLDDRDGLPNEVLLKLQSAINEVVRIQQFPNRPGIAPSPLLKGPVLRQLRVSVELANAIIQSWFATQETLYAIVRSYLHSKDEEVDYPDFDSHEFRGTLSQDDWSSACAAILDAHKELNENDVALMLCLATNKVASRPYTTRPKVTEPEPPHIIEQVRKYLELLPAASPEWGEYIPDFLAAATEIADRKLSERQAAATFLTLTSNIAQLEKYSDKLTYLELDIRSWLVSADAPLEDVSEAIGLLSNFSSLLEDYELALPAGSSITEEQRLWEERISISRSIQQQKAELDLILIRTAPPKVEDFTTDHDHQEENQVFDLVEGPQPGLTELILSRGRLEFSPTITDYSIELDNSETSFTLTPFTTKPDATVKLTVETPDGTSIELSEGEEGKFEVPQLYVGQTTIFIGILPADQVAQDTYKLTVNCVGSDEVGGSRNNDASLKTLVLSTGELKFDQDTMNYSVELTDDADELTILLEATDKAATVTLSAKLDDGTTVGEIERRGAEYAIGRDILSAGDVTLSINVTAEDSETNQVYSVLLKEVKSVDLPALMWTLVSQDDLAGAYWLSKSMRVQGLNPPVEPSLLKAVQGARWLTADSDVYVEDLFDITGDVEAADDRDDQILLRLAASLLPSLIAPETNMLGWLSSPRCLPIMDTIISPIKEFAAMGHPLLPEHVNGDEGFRSLEGRIVKVSDEARRWLSEAPNYQTNYRTAVIIWQNLCRHDLVGKMLTVVAEDNRSEAEAVHACVDEIMQGDYAKIFDRGFSATASRHSKPTEIVGGARDWLIKRLGEAKDRAEAWYGLITRARGERSNNSDQWFQERVSNLRQELRIGCPSVKEGLRELDAASNPSGVAGSAKCAARSLEQLVAYLDLGLDPGNCLEQPAVVRDMTRLVERHKRGVSIDNTDSVLETAMATRLFWVPSLEINDEGLPKSEDELSILTSRGSGLDLTDTPLEEAIRNRIDNLQDFRFVDVMTEGLPRETIGRVDSMASSAIVGDKKTLENAINATRVAVEQAEKDGVIEYEGSIWDKHEVTLISIVVDEIRNFKAAFDSLDGIRSELDEERDRRRQELMSEWDALVSSSGEAEPSSGSFFNQVNLTFKQASNSSTLDIRVMEDCVSRLRNYQADDEITLSGIGPARERTSSLEGFLSLCQNIEDPKARANDSSGLKRFRQQLTTEV